MTRSDQPGQGRSPCIVRHHIAGGCEHGGGIGRLAGYVIQADPAPYRHRVQDTRGMRFRPLRSGVMLAGAILAMIGDRIAGRDRLQHLHVAGRGSTARKLILSQVARLLGQGHVLHLHDFDYAADLARRPQWQQAAIRRMFRRAQRVIVLGGRDQATVRDLLGVAPDRITVLRNCVPDPHPQASAPSGGPCRIVFLGQLGARKGVPELLSALAQLRDLPWVATLAGDGPLDDIRAQVADLGLAGRVQIPGWIDQARARALCDEGDILVLPSHAEGMAMAVIEGLAHRMAVVTTRVGAHDEVLTHDRTCLFVPVGDADALADTLARLIADPALRQRLADAGRALFLSRMEIGGYVARLSDLHGDLAARPLPKRELA
ncbi:glycosyltransferase family 4 protein [Paracoccus indicus]|uniref:glycosyltransferase family 4 protein n=1 Tax=Paracoccus indicus TaxID=2079229 RepID=UPI000D3C781E|nr:glycosyltransferase family 4 protein [Paracoccus indicus]